VLYWIYIIITGFVFVMLSIEFWSEEDWQKQAAIAMVLIVCILRILQIK
jgi:hypothetical protein